MGAPQIVMIVLLSIYIFSHLMFHGESRGQKYNFFGALFGAAIQVLILWWGGFWG